MIWPGRATVRDQPDFEALSSSLTFDPNDDDADNEHHLRLDAICPENLSRQVGLGLTEG